MGKCNIFIKDPNTWDGCIAPTKEGFVELKKEKVDRPKESCCYEAWDNIENKRESECFWTSNQLFKIIGQKYDLDITDFYQ